MGSADRRCGREEEAAQLALGLLSGSERADGLTHLTTCRDCRSEVEQFAELSDRLVLLTPPSEPPPGFESDVLAAMNAPAQLPPAAPRPRPRLTALLSAAAAAAVALAIGLTIASPPPAQPLAWGADMVTPSGRDVGEVQLQSGEPSWLLVSVPGWKHWDAAVGHPLNYRLRVELTDGRRVEIDGVKLSEAGGWGTTPAFDPQAVREVSIVDTTGRVWCTARVEAPAA